MDFFTAQHPAPLPGPALSPSVDPFAQEIGRRFSLAPPLHTTSLSPLPTTVLVAPAPAPAPDTRLGALSLTSAPPSPALPQPSNPPLASVAPAELHAVLNDPGLLVLDIRPHGTFTRSRLPHALSLCVPSTLLKRPAFSLAKLAEMLPATSRRFFVAWRSAARILVYDADSQSLPEGSNIRGLLRKFHAEGFRGHLLWLAGGLAAVSRECPSLVDSSLSSPDASEEDEPFPGGFFLRAKRLPSTAFQQISTTSASQRPPVRSSSPQDRHHVAPAPTSTRPVAANPFYDNIRQNRELANGITERIPLRFPPAVVARRDDLPFDWLRDIIDKAHSDDGTDALAMQFYMIELREQRRLMGVMDHHSREVDAPRRTPYFPYSITAGIEKGSKNRYTNIWPFEHARVRISACSPDDSSDYINASHVQPLGTDRRYIATQGPLPTTYTDFWTLCWEQDIRIIVMLTKEVEGVTIKCGSYWTETAYGPLRLQPISSNSAERASSTPPNFDFGLPSSAVSVDEPLVRRVFLLSHTAHPEEPPRRITQLQYLAWPDFHVPEDPAGLLGLMREVDALRAEEVGVGPVLLHCSAGIGRTGGFIVVDAALDGIRREMQMRRGEDKDKDKNKNEEGEKDRVLTESPTPMVMDPDNSVWPLRPLRDISPIPRRHHARGHIDSIGTDTSGECSISPAPVVSPSPLKYTLPPFVESEPASAAMRLRTSESTSSSASPSASASTATLPSVFSAPAASSSTAPSSVPSSPSPSSSFDYMNPRRLHGAGSPVPLSSLGEPVRKMLEDMREQRMSLCQSLRQYVFVHRAIVEGALALVDEGRGAAGAVGDATRLARRPSGKRGASPTGLSEGARLIKRPSLKRGTVR